MLEEISKRVKQFSTGSGLASLVFIGSVFGVEEPMVIAITGAIAGVFNLYDVVRNEKKVKD